MRYGDIVGYRDMCQREDTQLQRGMNFRLRSGRTVILMSRRKNAPYQDEVLDEGRVLIYEGHDVPRSESRNPKSVDQQLKSATGKLTQNGLFFEAAKAFKSAQGEPESVTVFEKIKDGIWVYNGVFRLVDAWMAPEGDRKVCKFRLEIVDDPGDARIENSQRPELDHDRLIPPSVKLEVWKRDKGRCVTCGATDNLHFDHILPFSRGGSSLTAANIQLLCVRHNLQKSDRLDI